MQDSNQLSLTNTFVRLMPKLTVPQMNHFLRISEHFLLKSPVMEFCLTINLQGNGLCGYIPA